MRSYSASSSLPFKQNTSQPETDPLTNLKWRGKSFLSSQPETDPLTVVSELLNPFSRDGMLKKEYFVSENANCPSDVVCVSFMYGPRLVEFAHSRKEMHFQHRQWSFFAIVDPGGLTPRWRSCSSGLGRCQGINGRMTLATVQTVAT